MERSRPRPRRRPGLVALLSALAVMGPLTVDLVLPAVLPIVEDIGAPPASGPIAITAAFLGVGAGQFLWGPLSDRYGRRRPLLIGMAVFILASVGCAVAPTIELIIVGRAVEGLCAAAGMVIARALLRDLYSGPALTRMYTMLVIPIAFTSVLGPVLGSMVVQAVGWRSIFLVITVIAVILGSFAVALVPETVRTRIVTSGRRKALRAYLAPLSQSGFLVAGGAVVIGSATMFMCLTSLAAVLKTEYGVDAIGFAVLLALNNIAVVVGSQIAAVLSNRVRPWTMLVTSLSLSVVGCIAVLVIGAVAGPLWSLQLALFVITFQQGVISPVGTSLAVQSLDRSIGAAIATIGGSQYVVGSLLAGSVAAFFGTSSLVMGIAMTVTSAATLVLVLFGRNVAGTARVVEDGPPVL